MWPDFDVDCRGRSMRCEASPLWGQSVVRPVRLWGSVCGRQWDVQRRHRMSLAREGAARVTFLTGAAVGRGPECPIVVVDPIISAQN